jgi:uncharacterized repeat protein (TIGR01451 family)
MRVRLCTALVLLFAVFRLEPANAAMRLTAVDGTEVTAARGPAPRPARPTVTANAQRTPRAHANVTITAGADTSAAVNDYRRIQDAINAAMPGDVITLSGVFNFAAPFAGAAWALGNDNTAATFDDYSVYVPQGLNNVTLTATSLGSATIQGPGDLASLDLEGFLYFDGGDNQNWTISNLQIFNFDLSIGMFNGAGGSDAFNGTLIEGNLIRIPTDLNGTVAPSDPLQNIGLHYSFGTNQTIRFNTIQVQGNSAGDLVANAATVGMQSNTSGGAVYDGLSIVGNLIEVINAQAAVPETILGFWENAHGHTSNMAITSNSFQNDSAGNDSSLNLQRAFRVTSHSSATTLVEYAANIVDGANIGFQWITGSNFAGNQAVVLTGNFVASCNTGVLVQSDGVAHLTGDRITASRSGGGVHVVTGTLTGYLTTPFGISNTFVTNGSGDGIWIEATAGAIAPISQNNLQNNTGFGLRNDAAPLVTAEFNWWGNNLAANVAAEVSGNVDFDPWLASGTDVAPASFGFQPFLYATTSGTLTTLRGTTGPDVGSLLAGDPVTMMMGGQTAFTALAQLLSFDIQLQDGIDFFTLGQTGIPTTFDGGLDNDTLTGTNVAQTWNVTGAGSGNIPGAANSFTGVEALRGGTAADSFVFGAAGSILSTVNGDLGVDSLDNSAIPASTITPTGPGTLDGFMGTATGIGAGFDNINIIANDPANLTVTKIGPATAPTGTTLAYAITVTNNGPNDAVEVVLTDVIPAGTTFFAFGAPPGWSCSTPAVNATGTVICTRVTMPVSSDSFTLIVNGPATSATVVNTATVTSANEGAAGDEADSVTTIVAAPAAPVAIPALDVYALLALMAMLALIAARRVT